MWWWLAIAVACATPHTEKGRTNLEVAEALTKKVSEAALGHRRRMAENRTALPTLHRPFVFFHQRKAGGSSVRATLRDAAMKWGLKSWIPCLGSVNCNLYAPPFKDQAVIFGGHIYWPSFVKMLGEREWTRPVEHPSKLHFDCLTIFRDPADRVPSCWNFRMRNSRAFDNLTAADLRSLLPHAMSEFAEGCNNEALRILSDLGPAEHAVNALTSVTDDDDGAWIQDHNNDWASDAVGTLARTLDHQQSCVVGILDRCEDTELAVRFFFPWFDTFSCALHENVNLRNKKHQTDYNLHPDVLIELKRQNALDFLAFKAASAMLDAQLNVICDFAMGSSPLSPPLNQATNFSHACTLLARSSQRSSRHPSHRPEANLSFHFHTHRSSYGGYRRRY